MPQMNIYTHSWVHSFKHHVRIPLYSDVPVERRAWLEKLVGLHKSPFPGGWKGGFVYAHPQITSA